MFLIRTYFVMGSASLSFIEICSIVFGSRFLHNVKGAGYEKKKSMTVIFGREHRSEACEY